MNVDDALIAYEVPPPDGIEELLAREDAARLCGQGREKVETIYEQGKLKAPTKSVAETFAYHLPCHLCALGDDTVTLRLLHDHFRVEVLDLQAGCCGLSGTFGMQQKNRDLSIRMARSLKNALRAAPTEDVLTECAACKMQIEHLAPATATHPIKIIAQAYEL